MNNKFYVYILKCSDNTLYTGYTTDIQKRLVTHNNGKGAKYTRARLPVNLAWFKELPSKSEALKEEIRIKKLSRKEKESIISSP